MNSDTKIGYKLFSLKKDGTIGPLFINVKQRLNFNEECIAEEHLTKGFAFRPGWHICSTKSAPHLSKKGRVWAKVSFRDYDTHIRPECQGGIWYTAKFITVLEILD
jgi:hypothetical protein